MWLILLATFSAIILLPLAYWYYIVLYKNRTLAKLPGPAPYPFIGTIFAQNAAGLMTQFKANYKQYGPIYKIYMGPQIRVVISTPRHMEFIMGSQVHISKSDNYDLLKPWLGEGLLTSTGAKWKERRRLTTPAFHFKILEDFMTTFNSAGKVLVEQLSKEVGKKSVDIYQLINLYSLDIICETSMGVKINAQINQNMQYVQAVRGFLNIFMVRFFSFWERNDLLFRLFSKGYKKHQKYVKILHDFTNVVIDNRREEYHKIQQSQNPEDEFGIKKRIALLDTLLQSESSNKLTNEDIREEIDTFMFEGHDTVTSGISFILFELAQNEGIQKKLHEEIDQVIGTETEFITMEHLLEMKYLDRVVKEGQRKQPSVPLVERCTKEDCVFDGIKYPKGTIFTMVIYTLHQDPEIYPNPEKFDPDRFLMENQVKRPHYAYVPFSAGPRNCIGQKFAILELKLAIVKVIQHFKLHAVPGFQPELGMEAILKSTNGLCVQLEKRKT